MNSTTTRSLDSHARGLSRKHRTAQSQHPRSHPDAPLLPPRVIFTVWGSEDSFSPVVAIRLSGGRKGPCDKTMRDPMRERLLGCRSTTHLGRIKVAREKCPKKRDFPSHNIEMLRTKIFTYMTFHSHEVHHIFCRPSANSGRLCGHLLTGHLVRPPQPQAMSVRPATVL